MQFSKIHNLSTAVKMVAPLKKKPQKTKTGSEFCSLLLFVYIFFFEKVRGEKILYWQNYRIDYREDKDKESFPLLHYL